MACRYTSFDPYDIKNRFPQALRKNVTVVNHDSSLWLSLGLGPLQNSFPKLLVLGDTGKTVPVCVSPGNNNRSMVEAIWSSFIFSSLQDDIEYRSHISNEISSKKFIWLADVLMNACCIGGQEIRSVRLRP